MEIHELNRSSMDVPYWLHQIRVGEPSQTQVSFLETLPPAWIVQKALPCYHFAQEAIFSASLWIRHDRDPEAPDTLTTTSSQAWFNITKHFIEQGHSLKSIKIVGSTNIANYDDKFACQVLETIIGTCVKVLEFKNMHITGSFGRAIVNLLAIHGTLEEIHINYCTVDSSDTATLLLCGLSEASNLKRVAFRSRDPKLRLCALLHGIFELQMVKELDIHVIYCTFDECQLLGRYLEQQASLARLHLAISRPRVNPDLAIEPIITALSNIDCVHFRIDDPLPCPEELRQLASATRLRSLDLSTCRLSMENMRGLLEGLCETEGNAIHPTLSELDLSSTLSTAILDDAEACHQCSQLYGSLIEMNTCLRVLKLRGNRLGDEAMTCIALGLRANRTLRVLELVDVGLKHEGLMVLASSLEKNDSLQQLDLSFNDISGPLARDAFASIVRSSKLTELDVSNNDFGHTLGQTPGLIRALSQNVYLTKLVLDEIGLGEKGVQGLWCGLKGNRSLEYLSLQGNYISLDRSHTEFCMFMKCNDTLKELNLSGNERLDGAGIVYIAHALRQNRGMRRCRVHSVDNDGMAALIEALQLNQTLEELALCGVSSSFSEVYLGHFFRALPTMGLVSLDLGHSYLLSEDLMSLVIQAVDKTPTLTKLVASVEHLSSHHRSRLDFLVEMNRRGRIHWSGSPGTHLWALILASVSKYPRYLHFLLSVHPEWMVRIDCEQEEGCVGALN